jgi:hypothetical protein
MKDVVILKHTPASRSLGGMQQQAKYLCVLLEKQKDFRPIITYEEDSDFESLKANSLKPK